MRRAAIVQWRSRIAIVLMIALTVCGTMILPVPGSAQEEAQRPRNLLQFLFGSRDPEPRVAKRPANAKSKSKSRKSATTVRIDEPEALPKTTEASTVLVIGDFMAAGLAEGLASAYGQNPGVKVIDRSNGSSGFVRDDFHDWPSEIKTLIDSEKPAVVVIMIGANDRQQLKIADTREPPLSEAWTKEYQKRTDALAGEVTQRGVPLIWVGLPAFKSARVSTDLLAFNDIYRKSAENVGATFVDIWDGFVDETGAFVVNGPDMNGQSAKLRGSDGISLSRAGKRKVAFYAEKPLNKVLGGETVPALDAGGAQVFGPVAPGNVHVVRTQPMSIDDPELDGGQVLLGGEERVRAETLTAAEKLAIKGIPPDPSPGRADDFGGQAEPVLSDGGPAPAAAAAAAPVIPVADPVSR